MKKTFFNLYYRLCTTEKLVIEMDRVLSDEMSYEMYSLKCEILNSILKKRVPDDHEYSYLCEKVLGSRMYDNISNQLCTDAISNAISLS